MVLNRQRRVPVATQPLENFLDRVREELCLENREVTVQLISDAAIARLNRTFRSTAGPTDVLSFPANGMQRSREAREQRSRAAGKQADAAYLGDIAVSPETARRNARRFSRSLAEELRILILHGVLHLAGYDHETDDGEMNCLEGRLRRRLGLSA